jgi:glucosylceramidase
MPPPQPRSWVTSPDRNYAPTGIEAPRGPAQVEVVVRADRPRQTWLGVGGSLTQASASVLATLTAPRRRQVLAALFGPDGARYALSRTHVASCDFSTSSYTYAAEDDPSLAGFSIQVDRENGHLDLIRDALATPGAAFRLIASPWSAPPWMKDNGRLFDPVKRRGGRLLVEHYPTFARYLARYVESYAAEGVPIWALTPVNEPHGNQGTWESMEMTPEEQRQLLPILGQELHRRSLNTKILIYDQNRKSALEFVRGVLSDPEAARFTYGTAVHWYDSTFRVFEDQLDELQRSFPDKVIVHTEGCIDAIFRPGEDRGPAARTPWWRDDAWYWRAEANDWGWDWAPNPEIDHPTYAPAFRYARDLVGGMAHHLSGWVDWNIALDRRGGPNHVGNYCLAPVLVDGESDTVYFTPLYHLMRQVSRHSPPGATVLATEIRGSPGLWAAALRTAGGSTVVHLFNETTADLSCCISLPGRTVDLWCGSAALLTVELG